MGNIQNFGRNKGIFKQKGRDTEGVFFLEIKMDYSILSELYDVKNAWCHIKSDLSEELLKQ